ncbi:MAG: GNAT family N-acetyltransferase [Bacteroides sp.]|nr:GNAT family N-acetyltransferase [Bacteroides sp.]
MDYTTISITLADKDDLKEILSLQKRAFQTEAEHHGNYDIEPLQQTYESICADFESYTFLKAVCENRIIGSVKSRIKERTVWVGKLIVAQEARRQGLGKRLLLEVEKLYPEANRFQLFTASSSIHNIRLYESIGYRIVGEFKDDSQADLVLVEMHKEVHK